MRETAWRTWAAVAAVILATTPAGAGPLKATLVHGTMVDRRQRSGAETPLARIEFCARCENPHEEGSFVHGLSALQGVGDYRLNASLVYAVPNDARRELMNRDEVAGRLVMCERGTVPLVKKIIFAQDAGALGVVIVDDGQCTVELECGRAGSVRLGGFAPKDDPETWRKVAIPAVLVSVESGAKMRRLMHLDRRELPKFGSQYLNRNPTSSTAARSSHHREL